MRLIQLSDIHLGNSPHALVNNFPVYQSFLQVFNLALTHQPAHLLLTGDLSNEGDWKSYQLLESILSSTDIPATILYGNHDRPCELIQHRLSKFFTLGNWQILCLNSVKHNAIWGEGNLSQVELQWLTETLMRSALPTLIALHHHPIAFDDEDLSWLNQIHLENRDEFLSRVGKFPQVKGIIFGHIHRAISQRIAHFAVYGCPSTCYQVSTSKDDKHSFSAGFRVIDLQPDGTLSTQIVRLPNTLLAH